MLIPCHVEWHAGCALLVTFPEHASVSMLLQSDFDQIAFCYACGAPIGSGDPSSHDFDEAAWVEFDPRDITTCPDEYLDVATPMDALGF